MIPQLNTSLAISSNLSKWNTKKISQFDCTSPFCVTSNIGILFETLSRIPYRIVAFKIKGSVTIGGGLIDGHTLNEGGMTKSGENDDASNQ